MAKDFEIRNDISSDTESQVSDTRSDYRGELAKGDGVDLNEKSTEYLPNFLRDGQDEGKSINTLVESGDVRPTSVSFDVDHRGIAKAMTYDAVLPTDHTSPEMPEESALYCDVPDTFRGSDDAIDLNQYVNDLGEGFYEVQENKNAREENNDLIATENEPKIADHCDPPASLSESAPASEIPVDCDVPMDIGL